MQSSVLSHPNELTRVRHTQLMSELDGLLSHWLKTTDTSNPLSVRQILFYMEDTLPTVDVILQVELPEKKTGSVELQYLHSFHRYLNETPWVKHFADEVQVIVGSKGVEPTLFQQRDFLEVNTDEYVRVVLWDKKEAVIGKFTSIENRSDGKWTLKLKLISLENSEVVEFSREQVREATHLPFYKPPQIKQRGMTLPTKQNRDERDQKRKGKNL